MRASASGAFCQAVHDEATAPPVSRLRAAYPAVVFFACALTLVVIAWGSWVRAEGAGLACPDWPLCHGQVIPPMEKLVLIEWGHRLIAAVLGFAILFTTIGAWRWYRRDRDVLIPATAALIFVTIQVLLGGLTVTADLSPQVVSAHLGTSLAVFASMLVTAVGVAGRPRERVAAASLRAFPLVALFGGLVTYGLMLTGSYVVGSGASAACRSWPLCDGLPGGGDLVQVNMFHRTAVLLVGGVVVFVAYQAWRLRRVQPLLFAVAVVAVVIYLLQALVGAGNALIGVTVGVQVAHVATAATMWATMVLLVTLAWRAGRAEGQWSG